MKPQANLRDIVLVVSAAVLTITATIQAQQPAPPVASQLGALAVRSVPDGHYLITLQLLALDGQPQRLNIEVKDGSAQCVNSSDARLKGLQGKFSPIGNGAFRIFFSNERHRASQTWIFRKDGSAAVREVPDRGEQETAIPVSDDSIEALKQS